MLKQVLKKFKDGPIFQIFQFPNPRPKTRGAGLWRGCQNEQRGWESKSDIASNILGASVVSFFHSNNFFQPSTNSYNSQKIKQCKNVTTLPSQLHLPKLSTFTQSSYSPAAVSGTLATSSPSTRRRTRRFMPLRRMGLRVRPLDNTSGLSGGRKHATALSGWKVMAKTSWSSTWAVGD